MKILLAPDSFKGSMTSSHAIQLLKEVTARHFPKSEVIGLPIGDGGEGTTEALVLARKGRYSSYRVTGPLGDPVEAQYGILDDNTVIVEMAQASGLTLVPTKKLNPMLASSVGIGELVRKILTQGYRNIYLTIGGSATNDGGLGAAAALGIQFLDEQGKEVPPNASGLQKVKRIDASGLIQEMKEANVVVMCDVKNTLLGAKGATYTYGKQKGATPELMEKIESGMECYADIVEKTSGRRIRDIPGTGAAGGLVVPLLAFTNCRICSGIETVLSLLHFERLLEGVDFVVSGEGRLDGQSVQGKVLAGIGAACKQKGIPVVAVVGCMGEGASLIYDCGVGAAMSCVNTAMSVQESLNRADELFVQAVDRMYRFMKIGMGMECNILSKRDKQDSE
jgi:glycerate kinase